MQEYQCHFQFLLQSVCIQIMLKNNNLTNEIFIVS